MYQARKTSSQTMTPHMRQMRMFPNPVSVPMSLLDCVKPWVQLAI
jgi:hypothetical protein